MTHSASDSAPSSFLTFAADLSLRTSPLGGANSGDCARSFMQSEPVRPPAPVTATFMPEALVATGRRRATGLAASRREAPRTEAREAERSTMRP